MRLEAKEGLLAQCEGDPEPAPVPAYPTREPPWVGWARGARATCQEHALWAPAGMTAADSCLLAPCWAAASVPSQPVTVGPTLPSHKAPPRNSSRR